MYAIRSYYVVPPALTTLRGYRQFDLLCDRVAKGLLKLGIKKGDHVITSYSIHYTKLYDYFLWGANMSECHPILFSLV